MTWLKPPATENCTASGTRKFQSQQISAPKLKDGLLRNIGSMLPFAIIERASGKAVGMTTYMNIDATNRKLEIGAT